MKKILLILSAFAFGANQAGAQITIQRSDVASIHQNYAGVIDTAFTLPNGFTASGNAQVWDLSTLASNSSVTTKYLLPSETSYASEFPEANFVLQADASEESFLFFHDSADVMTLVGAVDEGEANSLLHFRAFLFPFKYNDTWQDEVYMEMATSGEDAGFPAADSVKIITSGTVVNTIDGEGTLKLPAGDKTALRIHRDVQYDIELQVMMPGTGMYVPLTNFPVAVVLYEFYAPEGGSYLASLEQVENDVYHVNYRSGFAGANRVQKHVLHTFPNPATEVINVSNAARFTGFVMVNQLGQVVKTGALDLNGTISVTDLAKGVYFLNLTNSNGEVFQSKVTVK